MYDVMIQSRVDGRWMERRASARAIVELVGGGWTAALLLDGEWAVVELVGGWVLVIGGEWVGSLTGRMGGMQD